jgi:hypothetical protein
MPSIITSTNADLMLMGRNIQLVLHCRHQPNEP